MTDLMTVLLAVSQTLPVRGQPEERYSSGYSCFRKNAQPKGQHVIEDWTGSQIMAVKRRDCLGKLHQ